jgi:hypothetical protein
MFFCDKMKQEWKLNSLHKERSNVIQKVAVFGGRGLFSGFVCLE